MPIRTGLYACGDTIGDCSSDIGSQETKLREARETLDAFYQQILKEEKVEELGINGCSFNEKDGRKFKGTFAIRTKDDPWKVQRILVQILDRAPVHISGCGFTWKEFYFQINSDERR